MNGVITAFGANAVKHVEEENRREHDTYKDQKSTEDWNVLGMLRKQGIVPKTIARVMMMVVFSHYLLSRFLLCYIFILSKSFIFQK